MTVTVGGPAETAPLKTQHGYSRCRCDGGASGARAAAGAMASDDSRLWKKNLARHTVVRKSGTGFFSDTYPTGAPRSGWS